MMSHFSPAVPVVDLSRLALSFLILYFVKKMEDIKCLTEVSWKPTYIKFYCIAVIILLIISMFVHPSHTICRFICFINIPLSIVMAYAVFTYIRELEDNFMKCQLSQEDKYVHEFLKLYSLVVVTMVAVSALVAVGAVLSLFPIPKYMGAESDMDKLVKARASKLKRGGK